MAVPAERWDVAGPYISTPLDEGVTKMARDVGHPRFPEGLRA
jgi:hypothetical protein